MQSDNQLRWWAVAVLVLSSALNYLDRMVLNALMPTLRDEFHIGGEQLGMILTAFSIPYALASPVVGYLIDRIGLKWGASLVVALWSMAGVGTGLVGGLGSLLVMRGILGFAEAGGVPATGKGFALYLEPQNRAIGTGLNQVGLTIGAMAAPVLTEFVSARYGWRAAFVATGVLGLLWLPFWLRVAGRAPAVAAAVHSKAIGYAGMFRDARYVVLIIANILAMTVYSLWTNWTTFFLHTRYSLRQDQANLHYAWIPPVFATLGGLFGGWLAQRLIRGGLDVFRARIRISIGASLFVFATAFAPVAATPGLATAAVCASLFFVTCMSVNYYAIPLDLFGAGRAAFAVSFLTGVFGLMQAFLSPWIGRWSDTIGWQPVCLAIAFLPLASALLLFLVFRREPA